MQQGQTKSRMLATIRQSFARHRSQRAHAAVGYPEQLQRLATTAVSRGIDRAIVARAGGVSAQSVYNWQTQRRLAKRAPQVAKRPVKKASIRSPRELKLTSGHWSPAVVPEAAVARISFRSGVLIDLPVGALTAELMKLVQMESTEAPR